MWTVSDTKPTCYTDERGHHAVIGCNCRQCVDSFFHGDDDLLRARKPRAFGIVAVDDREV